MRDFTQNLNKALERGRESVERTAKRYVQRSPPDRPWSSGCSALPEDFQDLHFILFYTLSSTTCPQPPQRVGSISRSEEVEVEAIGGGERRTYPVCKKGHKRVFQPRP